MMVDVDAIKNDLLLSHISRTKLEGKRTINSPKPTPKHQPVEPDKTSSSISIPMQTWLSQTPAEEPFNLVGQDREPSRQQHSANESEHENHDPDEWSLEVVYGGENGKEYYSSEEREDGG